MSMLSSARSAVVLGLAVALLSLGCGGGNGGDSSSLKKTEQVGKSGKSGKLVDSRDGQKYRTVKIGNKVWMAENLKYKIGDSWCYENDESNCDKYGRLYDWDMAMRACPTGWHLSSSEEWTDLVTEIGSSTGGTKLKAKSPDWDGTDEFGFLALSGGRCIFGGVFDGVGSDGYWWTVKWYNGHGVSYIRRMSSDVEDVKEYRDKESAGFSVRCLRD